MPICPTCTHRQAEGLSIAQWQDIVQQMDYQCGNFTIDGQQYHGLVDACTKACAPPCPNPANFEFINRRVNGQCPGCYGFDECKDACDPKTRTGMPAVAATQVPFVHLPPGFSLSLSGMNDASPPEKGDQPDQGGSIIDTIGKTGLVLGAVGVGIIALVLMSERKGRR